HSNNLFTIPKIRPDCLTNRIRSRKCRLEPSGALRESSGNYTRDCERTVGFSRAKPLCIYKLEHSKQWLLRNVPRSPFVKKAREGTLSRNFHLLSLKQRLPIQSRCPRLPTLASR